MGSHIQELENNESLLLMYIADELPVEDRTEVEQLLAHDAGLRASLGQLSSAYHGAMGALARLDSDRSAEPAENHAIRQASRAMKQWQVDRLSRQPTTTALPRTRMPVWAYPIGVAAMLLIGALIWWGGQGDSLAPNSGVVARLNTSAGPAVLPPAPNPPVFLAMQENTSTSLLENSFNESTAGIADAETQARSLVARSDNDAVASSIYLQDVNQ